MNKENSLLILLLICNALIGGAVGQYETEFLGKAYGDTDPVGVVVRLDGNSIFIDENRVVAAERNYIAEIKYTGTNPEVPTVLPIDGTGVKPELRIVKDNALGKFFLELLNELDNEDKGTWYINLDPTAPAPILVAPVDIDDMDPSFTQYATALDSDEGDFNSDKILFTYKATDPDTVDTDKLTYALTDLDNGANTPFVIDSTTGQLRQTAALDYQLQSVYRLQMTVTDSDGVNVISAPSVTLVNVNDLPNQPPRWVSVNPVLQVAENNDPTTDPALFKYGAVDGDTMVNSPMKYYLEGVPVDPISSTPYLTIDEASGEIRVNVVLDAEQIEDSTFTFQVVAEEMINTVPNLKIKETVTFFILDENDNLPIFDDGQSEKPFQVVIDENTSGSLPGLEQLIIIDKDRDLAYNEYAASLKADDPDMEDWVNEMFSVTPSKGYGGGTFVVQIKPTTVINYEEPEWQQTIQFYVTVEEASDATRFARGAISLTVQDLNDNSPVFDGVDANGEIVVEVSEGILIGETVTTILATDTDISPGFGTASIRYFWGVPTPNDLAIDEVTGIITTKTNFPFDRELMSQEVYIVNAVDSENAPNARRTSTILRLVILDVNDEPPLITATSRQITIQENTQLDFVFEGIQVTDPDEKPDLEIECTVEGPTETQGWFTCESTTEPGGALIAKILLAGTKLPNYEVTNRVDIEMKASDGVQSSIEVFTVFITNLNDEFPVFDPIGDISYTETEVCVGNDCESESRREIHQFRVQDKDSPQSEIEFSITSKDPETLDLVEINPTNGILSRKVGAVIDRETTATLVIDVTAHNLICDNNGCSHDPNIFTTEEDVQIKINDINDEIPVFEDSPPEFIIEENESSGDIHTFVATDKDEGRFGEVVYFLDENYLDGHGLDKFEINEKTGVLSIKAQLDRETDAQYALRIVARDNGGSQSNSNDGERIITIFIKDVNDNAPEVSSFEFHSKFEDQISSEMELGKLQLHDIDEANSQNSLVGAELIGVTYVDCPNCDILMMNWRDHFEGVWEGATNTFRIYAKTNLRPYFGKYSFEVFAYDYGTPMVSSTGTFGPLEINDVNDHTPVVFFPTANEATHVYIAENHPILGQGNDVAARLTEHDNTQVRALAGDDLDDPNLGNGQITFLIDPNGEGHEYFDVVPGDADGIFYIAVKAQLVVDEQGVPLRVGIIAKDKAAPPRQSEPQIMLISVVPESNQEPIFVGENAEVHIQENATLPGPIVLLAASDLDTIGDEPLDRFGNDICYYIIAGDTTQSFQLEPNTNTLTLKQGIVLDREQVPTYQLSILAKNDKPNACQPPTTTPPLDSPSVLNVQIIVDDLKDTAPRFVDLGTCSGGVRTSTAEIGSSTSIVLRGEEDDLNDPIKFTIDDETLERSDPSLAGIQDPVFTISESNEILINFQANEAMQGYFTFTVLLTDSVEMQATQMCKVYLTTPDNYVEFQFDDGYEEFTDSIISQVETIMSENYGYLCNIDKVRNTTDENGNAFAGKTTIETHFIDENKTEPVPSYLITDLPYDEPEKFINLTAALQDIGLNLDIKSYYEEPIDETQGILTYILVGAVIVLTIVVVIVSVSCWFNSRRLSLRVRALTASTFGSQESGLNRADSFKLPNTNQHAVQGSNPVWATEGAMRALDTESVGSGGSVLIGLENDEDFKNYAEPEREDDFSFAFGPERTQGTFNPIFGANFGEDDADEKETQDHADEKETQDDADEKEPQDPLPTISGTIVGRRNPLSMQNFDDDE